MKTAGILVVLALVAAPLGAGERLKLLVYSSGAAPSNVIIQTIVAPEADNHALAVVAESEDFFRSSTIELDGDRAPRLSNIRFSQMPAGLYEVRATVLDRNGRAMVTASQSLNIW